MKAIACSVVLLLTSCGGDDDFKSKPVDATGDYSVNLTSRANACNFPTWNEGSSTAAIPFKITQSGSDFTGSIEGVVGAFVKLLLGSNTFQGTIDGKQLHATNFGTNSFKQGACTYTINMEMQGTLEGNALQG